MSRRLYDGQLPRHPQQIELNRQLIDRIVGWVERGAPLKVAARAEGVGYKLLINWIKRGCYDLSSLYGELTLRISKAPSISELNDLAAINHFVTGKPEEIEYEMEYVRDADGALATDPQTRAYLQQIARDPDGRPIIKKKSSEIKPEWRAAAWKMGQTSPNRWGQNTAKGVAIHQQEMDMDQLFGDQVDNDEPGDGGGEGGEKDVTPPGLNVPDGLTQVRVIKRLNLPSNGRESPGTEVIDAPVKKAKAKKKAKKKAAKKKKKVSRKSSPKKKKATKKEGEDGQGNNS